MKNVCHPSGCLSDRRREEKTLIVPGKQSHHGGEDADKVEDGVGHLSLEDPVRVGWRVTRYAGGAVDERHDEEQRHTAQHDQPVDFRLQSGHKRQL